MLRQTDLSSKLEEWFRHVESYTQAVSDEPEAAAEETPAVEAKSEPVPLEEAHLHGNGTVAPAVDVAEDLESKAKNRPPAPNKGKIGGGRTARNETREALLARLLDPVLSLEEAAQVLNVCPATVRRYTNRGMLPHFRSSGNQRRFRLSKVLQFMETHERKAVNGTFDFEDVQEE